MGTVSETFRMLFTAETRGAAQQMKRFSAETKAELDKTDAAFAKSARGRLKAVESGLKGAAGFIGASVAIKGIESAVDAAADLQTAMLRVESTFQGAASEVKEFAKSASSIGLAADAAAQGAAVFGELLTQLGFGRSDAAGYSQQLLEIASGFAAMNNADPSAVIQAVAAAFRGEYDSLQRYLPAINDAIIRQRAVSLGYAKTTKDVDEYGKAQAALNIILDKGQRAVEFLAEAQDTAAFRSKQLKAEMRNLSAEIGEVLLPVVNSALESLLAIANLPVIDVAIRVKVGGEGGLGLFSGWGDIVDFFKRQAENLPTAQWDPFGMWPDDAVERSQALMYANDQMASNFADLILEADRLKEAMDALNEVDEEHAKYLKMVRESQTAATKADKERLQVIRDELWRRAAEQAEEYQKAVEKAADADKAAADAADDVVDAERRLVDSRRAVVDAERRVADARQRAVDLLEDERKAVEDLAAARRGAARDVERAQIRLEGERRDTREAGNSNTMASWLDQLDRQRLAELDLEDALDDAASQVSRARDRIADVRDAREEVLTRDIPDALQALEDARVDEFAASIDLAEAAAARAATALEALAANADVDPTAMRRAQEVAMRTGASTVNRPDGTYIENQVFNIQSFNAEAAALEIDRRFGASVAGTGQSRMRVAV